MIWIYTVLTCGPVRSPPVRVSFQFKGPFAPYRRRRLRRRKTRDRRRDKCEHQQMVCSASLRIRSDERRVRDLY
jgi:hypothetical protein